jgi:hypothetical protein
MLVAPKGVPGPAHTAPFRSHIKCMRANIVVEVLVCVITGTAAAADAVRPPRVVGLRQDGGANGYYWYLK